MEGDAGHGDKGNLHSYIPAYEELLAPYREHGSILEIGLAHGLSLKMWQEYFGEAATIKGMDKSIAFDTGPLLSDHRVMIIEGDATNPEDTALVTRFTVFDVIIDDGSHQLVDQIATFHLLKNSMREGGLYIIEDILSEQAIHELRALHLCDVYDFRKQKGRFDDVLIVYRF